MTEQFVNMAQSSLVLAMDDSSNPVSFDVVGAAPFPTVGDFRVLIDGEILLVTAVSGATFTANRAQEDTEMVAHSAGAAVTHILTAQSLANIVADAVAAALAPINATLAVILAYPAISGSRADPEQVLADLLTALTTAGIVDDQTSP